MERRAFVRAGLEVKWQTVPEGTGAMCTLLREDKLDMAVMVTEGAVRDILLGNPSRIVASLVDSPLTWGVHVGASTKLKAPADLVGVPFAISRFNSGSHLMAVMYAKQHGWEPKETDLVIVNDLKGAVERLRTSEPTVFLWEKSITAALVNDGTFRRVDEFCPAWPAFVVVARTEFLAENADAAARVMRVFRDQAKGLKEKKAAAEMIAQRYGMELADAKEWFGRVQWNKDGKLAPGCIEKLMKELVSVGLLPGDSLQEDPLEQVIWEPQGPRI